MCFLKTLKPLEEISIQKEGFSNESSQPLDQNPTKNSFSFIEKAIVPQPPVLLTHQDQLLFNLMNLIASNNFHLQNLDHKLSESEEVLNQAHLRVTTMKDQDSPSISSFNLLQNSISQFSNGIEETTVNPLIVQLFGKKKYLYKLQLTEPLPSTIYKERNINISVNLINQKGEKILNSNIIHLCLGVCDANAQWISENKIGENIMKGKTEVEMYHGQGGFEKVYPRDVSRSYPQGKINFIVYSKKSMLNFSSNSSVVEKIVDSNLIEPLLINDISIKAKKKE